ncbi:MAG: hypothetical protein AAGA77_06230 [Bacteroidota bacterium]
MLNKIFISYHFDDQARQLANKVQRLVISHNLIAVTGERLGGEQLSKGVQNRISECQAIIIILTKREAGKTNDWVKDERAFAKGKNLEVITLIEKGLDDKGMFTSMERLKIDFSTNDYKLLELSEEIGIWKGKLGSLKKLLIRPKDISEKISNSIATHPIRYRIWKSEDYNSRVEPTWEPITPRPEEGGATLLIPRVRESDLIEVEATVNAGIWGSPAANHNVIVELKKKR